jgi:FtsP/CotA-like multicopper oxidase with cupredoxin domain
MITKRLSEPPTDGSRRSFLRDSALAVVAASVLTACRTRDAADAAIATATGGAAPAGSTPPPSPTAAADAMDAMCERGVKAFPAATEGKGNVALAPRMDGHVKVFDLTCKKVQWETAPGQRTEAFTYNGMVPGPLIRVREGDRVRLNVTNTLDQSTAVHFHGLSVPNDQDGVPFITQPPIKPGQSYTYEFTVPHAGSHMYHSHHNATTQVMKGLLGAFIVDPRNAADEPHADIDHVMILNDGLNGFTLNGKGFPATEPIVATLGQTVRIRFMNEGMMIHPMHLHGMPMTVIAKDGWPQPVPWKCDTLNIAPGERWDVLVKCTNPGTWAFHCHILAHAESESGMFGMVTALVVKPAAA